MLEELDSPAFAQGYGAAGCLRRFTDARVWWAVVLENLDDSANV